MSNSDVLNGDDFIQFTNYLKPGLQITVSQYLINVLTHGDIPLFPEEFDGKPLTPFALSVNALPNHVRLEVLEDLKPRVGEKGAPTQTDLDELRQLMDMAADPIMNMFEEMDLLIKRKIWRSLEGWERRGLSRNAALLDLTSKLTQGEAEMIKEHMTSMNRWSMPAPPSTHVSSAGELVNQSDELIDQSLEALRQFRRRST